MPPEISYEEFLHLLEDNLTAKDWEKAKTFLLYYDLQNLKAFWKNEAIEHKGNLNEWELEEAVVTQEGFPEYVYTYFYQHDSLESRLQHFPELISKYFAEESLSSKGFLRDYLRFEKEWRLVLTGFRAKQLGRDIVQELQFEDPQEELVAQILAQKDAKTFIAPEMYQDLQALFEEHADKPLDLYNALAEYRFQKIEELLGVDLFSIERILGYLAQFLIVEEWHALSKDHGMQIINQSQRSIG